MKLLGSFLLLALPGFAQNISVGVKLGAPLTGVIAARRDIAGGRLLSSTERYTFGPMLDVRLPLGFGFGLEALYKRFDQRSEPALSSQTGSSFEFPVLGKYRFGKAAAQPYVEAGVSFHRLGDVVTLLRTLPTPQLETVAENRKGFVMGAGLEVKVLFIRISPGLRYTRWGARPFVPSTNLVDFLVGFTF